MPSHTFAGQPGNQVQTTRGYERQVLLDQPDLSCDKVTHSVDEEKAVDVVYLEFSKLILTPSPTALSWRKWLLMAWRGVLLTRWKNWLGDWAKRMVVDGSKSSSRPVTAISQGSVLGSVLFNIFIFIWIRGLSASSVSLQMTPSQVEVDLLEGRKGLAEGLGQAGSIGWVQQHKDQQNKVRGSSFELQQPHATLQVWRTVAWELLSWKGLGCIV